jgi:DNA-binding PadR family transcriptional regulator
MALKAKYVVLGMLIEQPGYGYDLRRRINDRLPFLGYTDAAVYPALDSLEEAGAIVVVGPKRYGGTTRGVPRVMYEATPSGVETFEAWMGSSSPPVISRDELLTKLEIARPKDLPRLVSITHGQEAILRQRLAELAEHPTQEWAGTGRVPLPQVMAKLLQSVEAMRLATAIESLVLIRRTLEDEIAGPRPSRAGR